MQLLVSIILSFGPFIDPVDIGFAVDGGVYVVDAGRHLVVKMSSDGDSLAAVGGFGSGQLQFRNPRGVVAGRGADIFVADRDNHRIVRLDRNLEYLSEISTRDGDLEQERFGYPTDVALSRQGDLFVLDTENRRVLQFDPLDRFVRSIGEIGSGRGRLVDPQRIEIDRQDRLYVLDRTPEPTVRVYDPFGSYLRDLRGPIVDFALDRGKIGLLGPDSVLRVGSLDSIATERSDVGVVETDGVGRMAMRDSLLYVIRRDRIVVAKFASFTPDTLQTSR